MSAAVRILPLRGPGAAPAATGGRTAEPLALRQRAFAEAILDPALPVPSGLVDPDGEPSAKRFSVYRNNVIAGLIEALKHSYPAVLRIVGEEFFAAMARIHVAQQPPLTPIMLNYGTNFAGFLSTFEPAGSLPYLPDVAHLERAWLEAYHAAEAVPLDAAALQMIAGADLAQIRLALHPSVRLVRSSFPVIRIWQTNIDGGIPVAVDIDAGGQDALVTRPITDVEVRELPPGAALFTEMLVAGATVVEAAIAGLGETPQFDLAGALAGLIAAGAIIGWHLPEITADPSSRRVA